MEKVIIVEFVEISQKVKMVKKVNIALRKDVHSQAKIISILKSISLNRYLELCIEKSMKEDQSLLQQIFEPDKTEKKLEELKDDGRDDNED